MKKHRLVAPVLITVIFVMFLLFYGALCVWAPMPLVVKVAGCIVLAGLIGVSVFVLVERVKEIRSGEEDDLSQY